MIGTEYRILSNTTAWFSIMHIKHTEVIRWKWSKYVSCPFIFSSLQHNSWNNGGIKYCGMNQVSFHMRCGDIPMSSICTHGLGFHHPALCSSRHRNWRFDIFPINHPWTLSVLQVTVLYAFMCKPDMSTSICILFVDHVRCGNPSSPTRNETCVPLIGIAES